MAIPEIGRSEDGHGTGRNPYAATSRTPAEGQERERRPVQRDSAEVHSPRQVALRLLRERVLQNARIAMGVRLHPAVPCQLPPADLEDVEGWVGVLWQELNALSGRARRQIGDEQTHRLLEEAFRIGTTETLDILEDLGAGGDDLVWTRIQAAIAALQGRVFA